MYHTTVYNILIDTGSWEAALHDKLFKDRVIVRPALHFNATVEISLKLVPTCLLAIVCTAMLIAF